MPDETIKQPPPGPEGSKSEEVAKLAPTSAASSAAKPATKPAQKVPVAPTGPPDQEPPEDLSVPSFITLLQSALPDSVTSVSYWVGDWTVVVQANHLIEVTTFLRDSPGVSFDTCSDVTAVDWPPRDQRFDVVYSLYSTQYRHRVRVKVRAAENEPVPSVSEVWPAANWLEREVYDMFGVNFIGHPDRRRLLMPDEWQGHPQRKDYPLEGPGDLLMENPLDWLKLRNLQDETEIE